MKINWRKFGTTFLFLYALFLVATMASGCGGVLSVISGLLPALVAAVDAAVSFVMALEGKTVPAGLSTTVQAWGTKVGGFVTNIQGIISAAAGQATAGVIAQIQAVLSAIQSETQSILSEFNVTDSATVSKFGSLVNLAISFISIILGLFPVALKLVARTDVPKEQLEAEAKEADAQTKNAHKAMQEAYVVIRTTPTASADVNTALSVLPTSLP